jgi:hypothetical protein
MLKKIKKLKPKKLKNTFSWTNPKLILKKTPKYGSGVFSTSKIKKGEIMAIFGGYIMSRREELALPTEINDNGIFVSDGMVMGVKKKHEVELASFFNHSCNPNAGFKGQIFLVAMRDVAKGEEITFDYAMVLSKSKGTKLYRMNCLCNSKSCRKIITDNDWRHKDLQKKYKGFFQFYIEEKINKIK